MLDTLIIGAGPAGIQAAYYLKKARVKYQILEKSDIPGAFFKKYPRHRTLISINKKYTGCENPEFNLRHDWNSLLSDGGLRFTDYDDELFPPADCLLRYLADFVEKEEIEISFNSKVKLIDKQDGVFSVELIDGQLLKAKHLIIATGFNKTHVPEIEGVEHVIDYSEMSLDRKEFANKRVLIIGKGNSSFETADYLASVASLIHLASPESIKFAWQTHYVGHLRAVNNNILDMYQLKSQHAMLDASVNKIIKTNSGYNVEMSYLHAQEEVETLKYDLILCCTGFKFDNSIFSERCMPKRTRHDKYPELTNAYESINVSGLYFAGTLTHASDYGKGTSGFIHGFRYNTKALAQILNYRMHGTALPYKEVSLDKVEMSKFLIDRFNEVSSTWQQPSILGEVMKIGNGHAEFYEALPVEYVVDDHFSKDKILLVTFEYGTPVEGNIFEQPRIARDNLENSSASQFLHPVLRHYHQGKLVEEFHVIEDLESHWTHEEHLTHVSEFITKFVDIEDNDQKQDTPQVSLYAKTNLPTKFGNFQLRIFKDKNGEEYSVISSGETQGQSNLPVRIHSSCFTSEIVGSLKCDCREQLEFALKYISQNGGIVFYLNQEGRGIGLGNKVKAYALQEEGADTIQANTQLGFPVDARNYDIVADLLKFMEVQSIRLITNNPRKIKSMKSLGIPIQGRIPVSISPNLHSQNYLETKRDELGHFLPSYQSEKERTQAEESPILSMS